MPQLKKKKLPNKRHGINQKVTINGEKIHLRTGNYPDGSLGEIFISMRKIGDTSSSFCNALCIAISIGLQYGIPIEEFARHYRRTKFEPAGMVVGHDDIKMCTSVLDYVFHELENSYGE